MVCTESKSTVASTSEKLATSIKQDGVGVFLFTQSCSYMGIVRSSRNIQLGGLDYIQEGGIPKKDGKYHSAA